MNVLKAILFAGIIGLTASCSVSKNCKEPDLHLPSYIVKGENDSISVADTEWWNFYGDSTLCRLITRTLENNKDYRSAIVKVERMQYLYRIELNNLLPSVGLKGLAEMENKDYEGESFKRTDKLGLKPALSWELDFFGYLRWARKKGMSEYLASIEQQRALQMMLVANVATEYYRLMALDNEYAIVKQTLVTRSEGMNQAKLRFEGGLTSETVYQQAQVEYATTAALIPEVEKKIRMTESNIALLVGEYPDWMVERGTIDMSAAMPKQLPTGVPSTLLQRRPDVKAAEMQLQSAMASAGMAYSDRFPRITFSLTGGFENDALKDFLKSPYSYIGGNLLSPLFDFGTKQAKYKASIAAYNEAKLAYEKKVLEAFKEVDDAITVYDKALETKALRQNLRDAAKKYVDLARAQYRGGSINYLDVLDAQRKYFDAQTGLSNAVRDEFLALIQLYKSLGGGWQS